MLHYAHAQDLKLMELKDETFLVKNGFYENLYTDEQLLQPYNSYVKFFRTIYGYLAVQLADDIIVQAVYFVDYSDFISKPMATYYHGQNLINRDKFRKIIRDAANARGGSNEA